MSLGALKLRDNLVIQESGGEWLVYDPDSGEVHLFLEPTARVCNLLRAGESWERLVASVGEDEVESILAVLEQKKLLASDGISRRSFLSKAASVAALVLTVATPIPAAAASACVTRGNTRCTSTNGTSCTPCTTSANPNSQCNTRTCSNQYRFVAPRVPRPVPTACSGLNVGARVCPSTNLACFEFLTRNGHPASALVGTSCRDLSAGGANSNSSCATARANAAPQGTFCRYFCCSG